MTTDQPSLPSSPPETTPAAKNPARAPVSFIYRGEGTGPWQRFVWGCGKVISYVITIVLFRLHVRGQNNIPRTGGVMLLSNHQSFLDPWLITVAPRRQLHYMARDTLFKGGFTQWIAEMYNTFPVRRGSADLAAVRIAVERLDKGQIVTIFPEGTRSEDGTIQPVIPGFSLILNRCKTDVSLQTVVLDGAFDAWPRHAKFPRPHAIRIAYGKPIPPSVWKELSPDQLASRIRQEFINLQDTLQSPHAAASRERFAADLAKAPPEETASRKRRR